jgi:hypothetical protein
MLRVVRTEFWAVGLALAAAAALAASLGLNAVFRSALSAGFRTPQTQALYPWTVRADLVLLVVLGAVVVYLARAHEPLHTWGAGKRWWYVVALLAGAAILAAFIGPTAGVAVILIFVIAAWLAPRLADDANTARTATLVGLGLRVAAGLILNLWAHAVDADVASFDDEIAYHRAAVQLAHILAAGVGDLDFEWRNVAGHHLDLIAGLYAAFGPDFMLVRIVNALLGALAVPVVYRVARACFGAVEARAAAWTVACWPLLVFWGGTGLREPLVVLVAMLLPWLLAHGTESRGAMLARFVAGAGCVFVLASLRPLVAVGSIGGLAVVAVVWAVRSRRRLASFALAAAGLLAASWVVSLASGFGASPLALDQATPRAIEYRLATAELTPLLEHDESKLPTAPAGLELPLGTIVRARVPDASAPRTGILYWYDDAPPRYRVKFPDATTVSLVPAAVEPLTDENTGWSEVLERWARGAALVILPPVPGAAPLRHVATLPDTLAWLALFGAAGVCVASRWRCRSPVWLQVVAFTALLLGGVVLASTNLGTAVRHRSMLVAALAVLASPALVMAELQLLAWVGVVRARTAARALAILGSRAPQA